MAQLLHHTFPSNKQISKGDGDIPTDFGTRLCLLNKPPGNGAAHLLQSSNSNFIVYTDGWIALICSPAIPEKSSSGSWVPQAEWGFHSSAWPGR